MSSEAADATKAEGGDSRASPDELRRELEVEFNVQRARMKELFLQKEDDLRTLTREKEQLDSEVMSLRAEVQQLQILSENQKSEIQNLTLLVNETVDASSSGSEEVRWLRARTLELEHQLKLQQQQEVSLAPATLVRNIARKLGADTDEPAPVRRIEDNELLNSIIQPLEMEITALKNKLRETDAQLQETLKAKPPASAQGTTGGDTKTESEGSVRGCDMCANYEQQLVTEQAGAAAAAARAARLQHALQLATEELEGVRSLHDETIRSWQAERAAGGQQLAELRGAAAAAAAALADRAAAAAAAEQEALQLVTTLTVDRETLQKKLDSLESDNAMLVGQFIKTAAEMQNELIDLPDNVEELQECCLRLREQLICSCVGRERARGELTALRAALAARARELDRALTARAELADRHRAASAEVERLQAEHEQMKELGDKLRQANNVVEQLIEDKKRLQGESQELRSRILVLQQELDNSEKVQQDFVRLSQSLQVQLQRIREADTEVRWQHEDDVAECPSCRTPLPNNKKKVHCRHCGRVYCGACVAHVVASGPRAAPARVCSVCRTLLQPHTAPYFSTQPPSEP